MPTGEETVNEGMDPDIAHAKAVEAEDDLLGEMHKQATDNVAEYANEYGDVQRLSDIEAIQKDRSITAKQLALATALAAGIDTTTLVEQIEFLKAERSDLVDQTSRDRVEADLVNRFTYHAPKFDDIQSYEVLRRMGLDMARLVQQMVPNGREKAIAMTKVEEAVMWANAGIARSGH